MRRFLISLFFLPMATFAAISANTLWEVQPTVGSDNNGGGFSVGVGTKTVSAATDLTIDASVNTKVISATHNFVAGDVGKYINITAQSSGTSWTLGYYKIVSTASNAATLDRSPAAAGTAATATYDLYDGIDYSDVGATPHVNIDNATITATTTAANSNTMTLTAGYTTALTDVGNILHCTAGTNINVGMYEITAVSAAAPPSGTWTVTGAQNLTTAGGAASGLVCRMGGSLATIAGAFPTGGGFVASNAIFVKATGTLSVTATTTLSGGATPSNTVPYSRLTGYTSTRADGGKATIQVSSGSIAILTVSTSGWRVSDFVLDGNSVAGTSCATVTGGSGQSFRNIVCKNFRSNGLNSSIGSMAVMDSEITGATSCTAAINLGGTNYDIRKNWIHNNACHGILTTASGLFAAHNLITNETGASSDGISVTSGNTGLVLLNNTIDGSGRDNIRIGAFTAGLIQNNILSGAAGCGLNFSAGAGYAETGMYDGNVYYANGTHRCNINDEGITNVINGVFTTRPSLDVVLTGSPYTNAAGNDYSLNNTANAGAAARGAATPGSFLNSSTTGHLDGGAVQTAGSGATGGSLGYIQ